MTLPKLLELIRKENSPWCSCGKGFLWPKALLKHVTSFPISQTDSDAFMTLGTFSEDAAYHPATAHDFMPKGWRPMKGV